MWGVSSQFLQAIVTAPQYTVRASITTPDGVSTAVQVQSGTVTCDSTQVTRRTVNMVIQGDSILYQQTIQPGAILSVQAGVTVAGVAEVVPVFYGEITSAVQDIGAATITVQAGDMTVRLIRNAYTSAYTPGAISRVSAMTQAIHSSIPNATVTNVSADTGLVPAGSSWASQQNPTNVLTDLTKDGGTEAFQRPDGSWLIRPLPTAAGPSIWTVNRSLVSAQRELPFTQMVNQVIVTPASTTAQSAWSQAVASLTDTTHPLHASKIGVSPYFYTSATITSQGDANQAAQQLLALLTATPQILTLGLVSNPALECGDILTIVAPGVGQEPPQSWQHFVDTFNFDVVTGSMTLTTRQTQVVQ